jgi:hypothetical protein
MEVNMSLMIISDNFKCKSILHLKVGIIPGKGGSLSVINNFWFSDIKTMTGVFILDF